MNKLSKIIFLLVSIALFNSSVVWAQPQSFFDLVNLKLTGLGDITAYEKIKIIDAWDKINASTTLSFPLDIRFSGELANFATSTDGFRHFLVLDQLARSYRAVNIINGSFGGALCSKLTTSQKIFLGKFFSCYDQDTFNKAKAIFTDLVNQYPNILFVFGAGNDGIDAQFNLPGGGIIANNVVTVASTDLTDNRVAPFPLTFGLEESNFGSSVNISAPGIDVYAPKPGSSYKSNFSGTSASAPMITGVAGLIKAIKPTLTPSQIKQILISNADPIQTDKPIGGRLNALKAVCDPLVLNCAPTPPPAGPAVWPMLQRNAQHTGLADVTGPPFATSTQVTIKWQKPLGLLTDFPPLIDSGKIYIGAGFNLLAFDAASGNQIWQTNIPAGAVSGAVGPDGTIYVCGLNSSLQSVLTAVDANSHQVKWQFVVGSFRPCNSPVVDKNGVIYTSVPPAFNTQLAAAVAVNSDGSQKWRYEEGNIATTPPAFSNDESQVYVIFFNRLLAFNSQTGQILWAQNLPVASGFPNFPIVDSQERVLILNPSAFGGFITAFSKSGVLLWQKPTGAFFIALYPNNRIVAVSLSNFSLLNSSDGATAPNSAISFPPNFQLIGAVPPAVDINGIMYIPIRFSDTSVGLAVFDPNGLRWSFSTPAGASAATGGSAIGLNNILYFTAQGILFALGQ